jgi:SAM-dependent methyltransferase
MKTLIKSSLNPNGNAKFVRKIPIDKITNLYREFNLNITHFFNSLKEIELYECESTGYQFFYPFNTMGDSAFYEQLQQYEWYYMPWKWEHEIAVQYLSENSRVLEIGCAHGAFIKRINELFNLDYSTGLELNQTTRIENDKWSIENLLIQDYVKNHQNEFDFVCSFQVLEHIADVNSFIHASVQSLKKGGKLLISVPNNDSFLKYSDIALNLPPHHMGLWGERSLISLTNLFPLNLVKIHIEKLQDYHIEPYIDAYYYKGSSNVIQRTKKRIHKKIGKYEKIKAEIRKNQHTLTGQTILAVYEKI